MKLTDEQMLAYNVARVKRRGLFSKDDIAMFAAGIAFAQTWRPMEGAPKDGTQILILVRHANWQYCKTDKERAPWQEICKAHWINHNDGGWTYYGICGQKIGWLPLPPLETANGKS